MLLELTSCSASSASPVGHVTLALQVVAVRRESPKSKSMGHLRMRFATLKKMFKQDQGSRCTDSA